MNLQPRAWNPPIPRIVSGLTRGVEAESSPVTTLALYELRGELGKLYRVAPRYSDTALLELES